jgi:hypothetical protein
LLIALERAAHAHKTRPLVPPTGAAKHEVPPRVGRHFI